MCKEVVCPRSLESKMVVSKKALDSVPSGVKEIGEM